jgi:hypothetical protein
MDGGHRNSRINLQKEWFTAENIADLFRKYNVTREFDHLTIDIDMNTWYVLQAVLQAGFRPRHITFEFNRNLPPYDPIMSMYLPNTHWGKGREVSCYFGGSPWAFQMLLDQYGYTIYAQDTVMINMYAVRLNELGGVRPLSYEQVLHNFKGEGHQCWALHRPCSNRTWVRLPEDIDLTKPKSAWADALIATEMEEIVDPKDPSMRIFKEFKLTASGKRKTGDHGKTLDQGCDISAKNSPLPIPPDW